jgi:Flp pilus assembly protein TadD
LEKVCEICNRSIETHLANVGKRLCFSCLTENVSENGALSTFNLKQKPVQAHCAVCDNETSGADLVPSPWGFICNACCDICETQTGVSWEIVTLAAQKEWLIKANTKVLGPYSTSEIEEHIRDHHLVAHDEIMRPAGRWHLLRDEEQFRLVVNEVKNRKIISKDRSLDNTLTGTGTLTGTLTGTMTPHLTEVVSDRAAQSESLVETAQEKEAAHLGPAQDSTRDLLKTYASLGDQKIVREFDHVRNRRVWLGLVLLLSAGVFVALKFMQPHSGDANSHDLYFQELMDSGLKAEKVGNFQKALAQYSEARTLKPDDPELLHHLAPIALVYDRQLLQAQRMFTQILQTVKEPIYQKESYVGLGLIALQSHDLDGAKNDFTQARNLDAAYEEAIGNLGIVAFLKDDFPTATDLLLKALEKGPSDGSLVITLSNVYISQSNDRNLGRQKLIQAHNLLDQFLGLSHDYTQEVLVQDSRVLSLLSKPTEVAQRIEIFLDTDPEETDLHLHNWAIDRQQSSWGVLLDTFKRVGSELTPSPRLTAALGVAMYRGQEKLEGAQTIEQALSQSPKDPLLMALAGWVELKLGRRESGEVNIKQAALLADKYKLPHILQARLCQEQNDFDCARQNWEAVLRLDGRSVAALQGLAAVAWAHHDRELTSNYLTQVYANDPFYIPYLKLIEEMRTPLEVKEK